MRRVFQLLIGLMFLQPLVRAEDIVGGEATAPSTHAARWNELAIEKKKATFSFEQDGKTVEPDDKGVVHLKAKAFAIVLTGDRQSVSLITVRDSKLLEEFKKHPLQVASTGSCIACPDTELYIEEAPIEVFSADDIKAIQKHMIEDKEEAEEFARELLIATGGKVSTLMNTGRQCLKEDDAESFNIGNLAVGDDTATIKPGEKLEIVVFLDTSLNETNNRAVWKSVRVEFGAK